MISGISHITFIVKDLEKMKTFLTTIFDAKEIYSSGQDTYSLSEEKFYLIDDIWIATMKGEETVRTYNHLAFKIDEKNYDEYIQRIDSISAEIKSGRTRVNGEGKSIYFYDFDNHLFELHTGTLGERLNRYKNI